MLQNLCVSKEGIKQFKIILEDWLPKNSSILFACEDKYIHFEFGIEHMKLKPMESIHPDSVAAYVLKSRQKTEPLIDETIFGKPFYVIGYPILFDHKDAALIIVLPSSYNQKQIEPYEFLTGKDDEEWTPIPVNQITHIESLQKRTWFFVGDQQYKINITLKELQTRLPDYFIRIHRSYIINIYFIEKISKDLTTNYVVQLKNRVELPISNSYINNLRNLLQF